MVIEYWPKSGWYVGCTRARCDPRKWSRIAYVYSVLKGFRSENGAHFRDGEEGKGREEGKENFSLGFSVGNPYFTSHDIHHALK